MAHVLVFKIHRTVDNTSYEFPIGLLCIIISPLFMCCLARIFLFEHGKPRALEDQKNRKTAKELKLRELVKAVLYYNYRQNIIFHFVLSRERLKFLYRVEKGLTNVRFLMVSIQNKGELLS